MWGLRIDEYSMYDYSFVRLSVVQLHCSVQVMAHFSEFSRIFDHRCHTTDRRILYVPRTYCVRNHCRGPTLYHGRGRGRMRAIRVSSSLFTAHELMDDYLNLDPYLAFKHLSELAECRVHHYGENILAKKTIFLFSCSFSFSNGLCR